MKMFLKVHHRVTIDVDTNDFDTMMRKLTYGLRLLNCRFEVFVSGSKIGYHIILHKKLPIWKVLLYRFIIGDDKKRLRFDIERTMLNETISFDLLFQKYRKVWQKTYRKRINITNLVIDYMSRNNVYKQRCSNTTCQKPKVKRYETTTRKHETNVKRNRHRLTNRFHSTCSFFGSKKVFTNHDILSSWCYGSGDNYETM